MKITIGDKTRKCMEILGIKEYPFSEALLKNNFNAKIMMFHEDKGGDKQKAQEIIAARSWLRNLTIDSITNSILFNMDETETDDIFTLYDPCTVCHGSGKKKEVYCGGIEKCWDCGADIDKKKGKGYHKKICAVCDGNGVKKNGYPCKNCDTKGYFIQECATCGGKGLIKSEPITTYKKCYNCDGKGKIKLDPFNPVIPKAAVMV